MDDPQIEIAYATNEEYLPVLGTSLHSLIEHTSMAHRYRISILMEEIATEQQERILNMQTKNVSIRFVDVHPWTKEYQIPTVGHLSQETAYRLVLDQIFREQEKVVYIDADTLIFHDVAEFFSVDIGEHVLGAVLGRLMSDFLPYVRDVLKFPLEDYFNAGILVINLPKFRRLNIGKRALSMLHSPKYLTRDQDVLNILCHHDVQYLDGRWNVEQQPLCFPEETPFIDAGREGSLAYLEAPFILHYASPRKPWNVPEYPKADLWWREARHAGFAHDVAAWMRKKEVAPISSHRNVMAAEALVTKRG